MNFKMQLNRRFIKIFLVIALLVISCACIEHYSRYKSGGSNVEYGLRDIGKLSTAEYFYTHVDVYKNDAINGIKIPFVNKQFIYSCDGCIKAGVDFSLIKVDKSNSTITITLPEAEIHSSEIDETSFQLYDEQNNIFNPINVSDVYQSFSDMKQEEEKKAIEKGILDKASENAKILISNFVSSTYGKDGEKLKIEFKE